jgi:hypothetical protein
VVLAFLIGTTLGVMAGYLGGFVNQAIMRTVDVFYAFPSVLLAIAISGALGAGIVNSIVSLTIVFIPPVVRVPKASPPACAISISSMRRAPPARDRSRSCACTCSATCSGRSSSIRPA